MPIVTDASAADFVAIRVIGKITKEELIAFRGDFERLVSQRGKLRILFDITEFTGWDTGALWQEAKFDAKHFSNISRLATVGTKTWQQALEAVAKPFAPAKMRYFDAAEIKAAQDWLLGA